MRDRFETLASEQRHETPKVKGSRFIGDVFPVTDSDEIDEQLTAVRAEFHDARHHCWAWRLGPSGANFRSSDDGEPSGSAGRPLLQELEGRELTNALVVVTRYFGGTKLGVGGLVRAYSDAAGAALDRAQKRTVVLTEGLRVTYAYELSTAVQSLVSAYQLAPTSSEFGANVTQTFEVPLGAVEAFKRELVERTAGRVQAEPSGP